MTRSPLITIDAEDDLDEALRRMEAHHVRHLPVVDGDLLAGVLSDRDLLAANGGLPSRVHSCRGTCADGWHHQRAGELMHSPVVTIEPTADLYAVAKAMLRNKIGCLPIVEHGRLVGILTEQDLLRAFVEASTRTDPLLQARVEELMSSEPLTIRWTTTLDEAQRLCREHRVRHLPVLEAGLLVGMVSDRDLRRARGVGRPGDTPVDDFMTRRVITCLRQDRAADAARRMLQHGFSSLPVAELDELCGIVTVTDLLTCIFVSQGLGNGDPGPDGRGSREAQDNGS